MTSSTPGTGQGEDVGAWAEHLPRLRRLCATLTGDPAGAEDAAQEVVEQAWRIRQRLDDESALGPWLDAVARNVCRRRSHRAARLGGRESLVDASQLVSLPDQRPGLEEILERAELVELLDRVLGLLPPATRAMLVARYVEERSPAQIAADHGLSPDAVSMRLTRGRARLRALLEDRFADEPLAEPWLDRHGASWRSTRLRCRLCGRGTLQMRRDGPAASLDFRCTGCEPNDVGARYSLDNPSLEPLLQGAHRPSAVLDRLARWNHEYWTAALPSGRAPCSGCGAALRPRRYRRPDLEPWALRHGWEVVCHRCGTALSTSVAGLAQQHPGVRAVLAAHPRMHVRATSPAADQAVERTLEVDRDPHPVTVGFVDPTDGTRLHVLLDPARLHPVHLLPDTGQAGLPTP